MDKFPKYLAEFLGTFVLAFVVVMSVAGQFPVSTPVLAGVVLMFFVYAIGKISGSHINPAVTVGLWTRGKIETKEALIYILVQLIAGTAAMYLSEYLGADISSSAIAGSKILLAEIAGAAMFGFGIMAVVRGKVDDDFNGIVIGASLFLGIALAALVGSAGVLNPAVAVTLGLTSWRYLTSSVVGVVVGMALYDFLIGEKLMNLDVKVQVGEKEKKNKS